MYSNCEDVDASGTTSQFKLFPNTLMFIKDIGLVYDAGIIAEIGDIHPFKNQAAHVNLQVLIGLSTSQATLRLTIPIYLSLATGICVTISWKPLTK